MAGPKLPSGSLRNHASNATKSRSQLFTKAEPKIKKETFVGDDSSDSSSDSESDSDSDVKNESAVDFQKRVSSTPSSKGKTDGAKAKDDTKVSKTATPAKSPTVNGLGASAIKKEKKLSAKNIKQEDTSSASESGSGSDSESSSDEKTKKATAKGKQVVKKSESTSESGSEPETSSASESESESDSDKATTSKSKTPTKSPAKAKSPVKEAIKSATKAAKSPVKKEASSESETSSADSESESEDDDSEDPSQQIEEQIRNDLKSAKSQTPPAQAEEPSKKKAKHTKLLSEDEDGDIEMMDQSMALTNGGNPTNVGDVPEFVAPDFHLRKLQGESNAADVAKFFSKAQLEGKQVWYITAPASLPVTVVQDLSIPMDQAQQGLPVLSHNGDDYRMAFDNPSASSSFRLLIPNKKGNEYALLERPVDQTMHFTRSETFPPEGPSSVITTKTISTTKPARPQPEGLRARYTPLGVPAPKPTIALPNKAVASIAAADAATTSSTPSKGSDKKKRKHTHDDDEDGDDDGEDGSAATAITTPVPTQKKDNSTSNSNKKKKKTPPAEKSVKKQKTSRDGTPRRETPVPVPQPQIHSSGGGYGRGGDGGSVASSSFTPASQPLPRSRKSASPGATLPATQVPLKLTPVPIPTLRASISSDGGAPVLTNSREAFKEREKQAKKAERERKKAEKEAEKARKRADKEAARLARNSPRKVSSSQIPPPRFDSSGRPIF